MSEVSRRHLIAGLLASAGPMPGGVTRLLAVAQSRLHNQAAPHRHPPSLRAAGVGDRGQRPTAPPACQHHVDAAKSIEDMDRGGVAASMVSITNPGLWFGDAPMTKQLARACNEYGAKLVQEHPTRFGCLRDAAARRRRDAAEIVVRLRHAEGGRHRTSSRATATPGWATRSFVR